MRKILILIFLCCFTTIIDINSAFANRCRPETCGDCCPPRIEACQNYCSCISTEETGDPTDEKTTMGHITWELQRHRKWMEEFFFDDHRPDNNAGLLAAMRLMSRQFVTNGVQRAQIIGSYFDAKHQMETQRSIQVLTARAHKDYQPSTNMCTIGTMTQQVSEASRKKDISASAISRQLIDRQLLGPGAISTHGGDSDQKSRLVNYIKRFCSPSDYSNNLDFLCQNSDGINQLFNRDISYAQSVGLVNTLELDLEDSDESMDEESLFALSNNLFSNDVYPFIPQTALVDQDDDPAYQRGAKDYLDARAVIAKRSVAANSLASIAAQKAQGKDVTPFIFSLVEGMSDGNSSSKLTIEEIRELIGDKPSYYAQMKVLSKYLYQRPEFYVDLYDKPANVKRMDVAVQAATLMRKRDLYRSYLRSEMILAVMLETALQKEIDLISNEIGEGGR